MLVEEALAVVVQAPFRHDRAAARHDPRHPVHGHRHHVQAHARVDGEIIHALFGLLDQRVAEHLPCEVFGHAIHLFQRLIDRHGADGHGAVADDPFAGVVDVAPRREIHHRIGAQRIAQTSFSTSSSIEEVTAEVPMLALTFTRKLRPMIIGSNSGWLILAGMMARPAAISERTNSGVTWSGICAPQSSPSRGAAFVSRNWVSRIATNSISGVTMPARA